MFIEHRNLTWTLMPLFLAGVMCGTVWKVEYQQEHICAVKGSSVVIPCSFYHPANQRVNRVMWGHVKPRRFKGHFISMSNSRKVPTRFQNIGDKHDNCSLKIHQVEHNDAGKYIVRFITNNKKCRQPSTVSPTLKVVDLNVSVTKPSGNKTIKEGDSVNLTCINGCDGGNLSSVLTWFNNGEPINEGPVLYFSNVSSTNSGNYTCSLKTHTGATSGVINIDVEYGPKNTSVSVSPSMEMDADSNITLICSGRANPPVENYTWFKIDDDDVVDVGHQPVFISGEEGQYLCRATNKHGSQNSSVVTLKIKSYWATFTRDALIISTVAVLLTVTTVFAIRRLSRKKKWTPELDCEEDIQNADYVNCRICDSNQSQEGRTTELVYATVDFNMKRKSNMNVMYGCSQPLEAHVLTDCITCREQQMVSHDDEDVIYSTVGRSQPLNPSYIEPSRSDNKHVVISSNVVYRLK